MSALRSSGLGAGGAAAVRAAGASCAEAAVLRDVLGAGDFAVSRLGATETPSVQRTQLLSVERDPILARKVPRRSTHVATASPHARECRDAEHDRIMGNARVRNATRFECLVVAAQHFQESTRLEQRHVVVAVGKAVAWHQLSTVTTNIAARCVVRPSPAPKDRSSTVRRCRGGSSPKLTIGSTTIPDARLIMPACQFKR